MQISLVKNSFYFTYIFLITTGTICFIEAIRNPDPKVRHIMNLETCISVVAGYFYGLFVAKIDKVEAKKEKDEEFPLEEINDNRYTDWAISTPLMLLVLCLILGMENKHVVNFWVFMLILLFNFLMLGAGYIGEVGTLTKTSANMLGFVFFTLMYGTIWSVYMRNKKTINSQVMFWLFVVLWAFYGVFYQTDTLTKIFGYNILDLLSKAFVGIFFWLYLTKSVKF